MRYNRNLSVRESEIAKLAGEGKTNLEIADELVLSVNTVKSYIRTIMNKSHCLNRIEIVAKYANSGQVL